MDIKDRRRCILISAIFFTLIILLYGLALAEDIVQKDLPQSAGQSEDQKKGEWVVSEREEKRGYDFSSYTPDTEVKFAFGAEQFKLDKPVFRKGDEIWVPLDAILPKAGAMLLKMTEDSFMVIRDDGTPLEFKSGDTVVKMNKVPFLTMNQPPRVYSESFMLSLESLSKILDMPYTYDVPTNTATFQRTKTEEFSTFTVEKPPVSAEEKKAAEVVVKPLPPPDIREEILSEKYRRDVDMKLDTNFSYLEDKHARDRTRQADWYLSGRAYDYKVDGHFRVKDFRVTNKQRVKQDGEFLSFSKDPVQLKFFDNNLSIPQLRSQSQPYFGTEITDIYMPFKSTAVFGRTNNTVSGPAAIGAVRYYGKLYAVKQEYTDINNLFKAGGLLLVHETEVEEQGKSSTTNYPRRNLLYVWDSTTHLYPNLDFFYTHGLSNYMPDNKVNKRLVDGDWRTALELKEERYSLKTSFENVGQQYVSIGIPSTYQDFQGWDFSGDFKFAPNWYGTYSGRLNKNNTERDPRKPATFDRSGNLGTGFYLPWQQNVNLSYSITDSITRANADESGNVYKDYRVDYSKGWKDLTMQLSYDHYYLRQTGTAAGATTTDSGTLTLFQFLPDLNNSYIRFYQDIRKTKTDTPTTYVTTLWNTDIGVRWNLTEYLSGNGDLRIATTQREAFQDTAFVNLLLGAEFKSSPVTTWNFDYNLSNWDIYNSKNQTTKFYTLLFKMRHLLGVSTPEKWGVVKAFVYRDLNSNGIHDSWEPGIPNVRVNVINGRAAYTNAKGIAIIKKVVPGDRKVKIDLSRLPLDMAVRADVPVRAVTVEPLATADVDFPIVATGKIKGMVYLDVNKNGVYDKKIDEGLQNVRIYLTPGGKETLTFSDGSYYFEYVYPGVYEVNIDMETTPSDYKLSSPEKTKVSLQESETLNDTNFSFTSKPIEIQSFDGQ